MKEDEDRANNETKIDDEANKCCTEVLQKMHDLGIDCGRQISKLARIIHPDHVTIIPLYRSCIVIVQSEEEKDIGICTVHSYGDPHWLGRDLNIETLKSDNFHTKFQIHGQRNSPELIFKKGDNIVRLPIDQGFDIIEIAEKGMDEMFKTLGLYDFEDNKNDSKLV